MVRGALIGFGVTLLLLLPPVLHLFSGPPGPFIGGFLGGAKVKAQPGMAVRIGLLMGLLISGPLGIALAVSSAVSSLLPEGVRDALFFIALGIIVYTGVLGSLGAWAGGRVAQRMEAKEQEMKAAP